MNAEPAPGSRGGRPGGDLDVLLAGVVGGGGEPLAVVDLGGGTGGHAVALARLGHEVLVVDRNADALAMLGRRAAAAEVTDRVRAVQSDVAELGEHVAAGSVDLVLCHGLLEVVDDPPATIAATADVLRPGGHVSVLAAGRMRAVLGRAVSGDLLRARRLLDLRAATWDRSVDGPRRYTLEELTTLVGDAGLRVERVDGVRVLADLVPPALVESDADRQALTALEDAAAQEPRLRALAGLLHVLAVRATD
ncbi:methyltransferase domain-containing protein [Mumia sp. DW29H23]|uniref:methyltransferase domain-containing protein n=1 Tax=Mumia sp. DW29H23 TaxID=3421241 RepID=UPI003D682DED